MGMLVGGCAGAVHDPCQRLHPASSCPLRGKAFAVVLTPLEQQVFGPEMQGREESCPGHRLEGGPGPGALTPGLEPRASLRGSPCATRGRGDFQAAS